MANANYTMSFSLPAAVDFTDLENRFVKIDSNGKAAQCTATTDLIAGVAMNNPVTDSPVEVVSMGQIAKIELGATLAKGALVTTDTVGRAMAAVATSRPVGQLIGGGAAGDLSDILLTGGNVTIA